MSSGWTDLHERHFDKMLLTAIFILLVSVSIFQGPGDWSQRMADTVLGSLLTIITGRAFGTRVSDPGGSGRQITKSTSSSSVQIESETEEKEDGK